MKQNQQNLINLTGSSGLKVGDSKRFDIIMKNAKDLKEILAKQKAEDITTTDLKYFKEKDSELR